MPSKKAKKREKEKEESVMRTIEPILKVIQKQEKRGTRREKKLRNTAFGNNEMRFNVVRLFNTTAS